MISWVVSIFLSIPITSILTSVVGMAILTAPMKPVYVMDGILIWLIVTIVLGAISSSMPARRASKLTVRDTLAYE